jgi:thiamine biosynthesis lipoprotein
MSLSRRALFSLGRRPPGPGSDGGSWLHLSRRAMACRFEITVPSELAERLPAAHAALDTIDALEDQLSVFRDWSEIAGINREAAEGPLEVEPRLFALLELCRELHALSDGAFDITSTPLSKVWGFLRREGRVPTEDELAEARARVGMRHVVLDPAARTVRFDRPGLALNLGSIGKGYALDRAAADLTAGGIDTALLSAGSSSLLALGDGPDGHGFAVGLRDPQHHDRRLCTVRLRSGALGVSGIGEQKFTVDGKSYGHIIDPRSGWPVEGRLYVAVTAPDATRADALATAFFVAGRALAERYVKQHEDVTVLMIDMPLHPTETGETILLGPTHGWSPLR